MPSTSSSASPVEVVPTVEEEQHSSFPSHGRPSGSEDVSDPTAKRTFTLRLPTAGKASPLALVLFAMLGISAWIETNALFSELWAVAPVLPESWNLASYLVVIIQLGNVAPLVYSYLPKPPLWVAMLMVLLSSGFSMFLACGIWDITAEVFGAQHSVGLLVSAFVASMSDCLSNLVFWPYAGSFSSHPGYVAALATGESLSSAASAAVVAIQSACGFGPTVYFAIIGSIVMCCIASFFLLHFGYSGKALHDFVREGPTSGSPTASVASHKEHGLFSRKSKRFLTSYILIAWLSFVQNALTPTFLPFAGRAYPAGYRLAQNVLFAFAPVASMGAAWLLGAHYRKNCLVTSAEVGAVFMWNIEV